MSTLKLPNSAGGATSVQVGRAAAQVAARALGARHKTKSSVMNLKSIAPFDGKLFCLFKLLVTAC
jgi:hypothetical protein